MKGYISAVDRIKQLGIISRKCEGVWIILTSSQIVLSEMQSEAVRARPLFLYIDQD